MTATSARTRPTGAARADQRPLLPTRQFSPGFATLGVVLIVGLAVAGAWLYQSAGAKTSVVQVVRQVPAGQTLAREDLSTVAVAGDLTAIGADHLGDAIGQAAAVTLLPGVLLQRGMLTATGTGLADGQVQVGVAVSGAQMPAEGLHVGDVVEVYRLPETDTEDAPQLLVEGAVVTTAVADPQDAGGGVVTVVVPQVSGGAVAAASGAGRAALVRVKAAA